MQFSAGGIHAIQRRRHSCNSAPEGCRHHLRARRDGPISHLLQLVTTCYNLLQLDHTDQHCLCAVGAVTHVTHVKGFACSDLA